MRALALALGLAALAGCASTDAPTAVAARDLMGPYKTAVRSERAGAPLPAATFAIEIEAEALPPEAAALVGSLLERRGWTAAPAAVPAEAKFELSDGVVGRHQASFRDVSVRVAAGPSYGGALGDLEPGSNGSGDILHRNARSGPPFGGSAELRELYRVVRRLEVAASVTPGDELWTGLAWIDAQRGEFVDDLNDLALALADRLPVPKRASAAREAVDGLGTDFVMVLDPDQRLVPVLLAVVPGGASARAGWEPRDLLLSIDGEPVAGDSWAGIAQRLAAAEARPVEVELLRAGESYQTFLVPTAPRPLG